MAIPDPRRPLNPFSPGLGGGAPSTQIGVLPSTQMVDLDDDELEEMNDLYGVSRKESHPLMQIIGGAAAGLLEPLSIIPGVEEQLDRLDQLQGDDTLGKISYGVGWTAGFLIPVAGEYKALALLGKGALQGLRGAGLLRAAESATELSRIQKLARTVVHGGAVGGLLEAGGRVEEGETRSGDILEGAIYGAAGDVAFQALGPALRTVFGSTLFKAVDDLPAPVQKIVDDTIEEGAPMNTDAYGLMAVAENLVNRVHRNNIAEEGIKANTGTRLMNLHMGIDELDLGNLEPGQVRMFQGISGNPRDIEKVLDQIPDIQYVRTERPGKPVTGAESLIQDFLISHKTAPIDPRTVEEFKRQGFVRGQETIHGGKKYILGGLSEDGTEAIAYGIDGRGKSIRIPRDEVSPMPIANVGPVTIQRTREWADFVAEHTMFPTKEIVTEKGTINFEGFESAFNKFANERAFYGRNRQALKLEFVKRQHAALREVDPELARVLNKIEDAPTITKPHPDGALRELAQSRGFILEEGIIEKPVRVRKGKKEIRQVTGWVLRDASTGERVATPFTDTDVKRYLKMSVPREMPTLDPTNPFADGVISGATRIQTPVPVDNTQLKYVGITLPWKLTNPLRAFFEPQIQWLKDVDEEIMRQLPTLKSGIGPDEVPLLYAKADRLMAVKAINRTESTPWLEDLGRIAKGSAGGLFKKAPSRWRPEMQPQMVDLLETAAPGTPEFAEKAAQLGLQKGEVEVVTEVRDFLKRMGEYWIKQENIDISAEDLIQNYFPHMRKNDAQWNLYTKSQGKKLSKETLVWLNEMRRTGEWTGYQKDDLFGTLEKYVRGGFDKKNVMAARNEMIAAVKQVGKLADVEQNPSLRAVANAGANFVATSTGNISDYTVVMQATLKSVFKELNVDVPPEIQNKWLATFIAGNQGAFMGFRVAMAARDMSGIIAVVGPALGSMKHLAHGIKASVSDAAQKELEEVGVVAIYNTGQVMDDAMRYAREMDLRSSKTVKTVQKVGEAVRWTAEKGMYFQGVADSVTRRVAYFGAKNKGREALLEFQRTGNKAKFDEDSGLTALSKVVTDEFHRILHGDDLVLKQYDIMAKAGDTKEELALKYLGRQFTVDTVFTFQQSAGPQAFSSTMGKMFGMYGTWPMWYATLVKNRATRGTWKDRAKFFGWSGAVHMAFMNAAGVTGLNLNKWSPMQFDWAGGPMFDQLKDATEIISGEMESGEPSPGRALALAKMGMRDKDRSHFEAAGATVTGDVGSIDEATLGFDIKDPWKLAKGTVGMYVPGFYAANDLMKALEEDTPWQMSLRALGFKIAE